MTLKPVDRNAAFLEGAGDASFRRKTRALSYDRPIEHTTQSLLHAIVEFVVQSLCEIGCSTAWRLTLLNTLPLGLRLAPPDTSAAAVAAGRAVWPTHDVAIGSAGVPPPDGKHDFEILSYVLRSIGPGHLARSTAAINRLVHDGDRRS